MDRPPLKLAPSVLPGSPEAQRATWLAKRRIGSSDIPAIVGLSSYQTALNIYLRLTGQDFEDKQEPWQQWGLKLEPVIAAAYEETTGRKLEKLTAPDEVLTHPLYPWATCTPDYACVAEKLLAEIKTVNYFTARRKAQEGDGWGEPGTDQCPREVLIQAQWQMAITGYEVADFPILISGADFRIYRTLRCQPLIDTLIEKGQEFWNRVQRQEPPEPDWAHGKTLETIKLMFRGMEDETVTLPAEMAPVVKAYEDSKQTRLDAEKEEDRHKAMLLWKMGNAARAVLPDGSATLVRSKVNMPGHVVHPHTQTRFTVKRVRKKP
jgi:putative phage-type endonuclease